MNITIQNKDGSRRYGTILLAMKLTILFSTLFFLHAAASVNAQSYTLSFRNAPLETIIGALRQQSGLNFLIDSDALKRAPKLSVQVRNASLAEALDAVFEGSPFNYTITDHSISIRPRVVRSGLGDVTANREAPVLWENAEHQPFTASGTVTDRGGKPIASVSVKQVGTDRATSTDDNGRFSLAIDQQAATLQFSSIGFLTKELPFRGSPINVVLEDDLAQLDEVVVVGYGTQRKINLTGSVEVVDGERLQNRPVNNVSQALQGTVGGVRINYGNNGFEPGAAPSVQIRGQGAPYVLIDGTVGDINTLDPNTIESISVLKDAAASAIYGARAPYGVLLITTKSGSADQQPTVDFSVNTGKTTIFKKPRMVDS